MTGFPQHKCQAFQLTKSESWTLEARTWRSGFFVAVPLAPPCLCTHICNGQDTGLAARTNIFPQIPPSPKWLKHDGSFFLSHVTVQTVQDDIVTPEHQESGHVACRSTGLKKKL